MTKYSASAILSAAAAAVVLVACGAAAPADPALPISFAGAAGSTESPPPDQVAGGSLEKQLRGRSFETTGAGDVAGFPLAPDSALTLSFYLDHENVPSIGGNAGCNSMGGPAIWVGDTVRATEDLAQTAMACDGLMEQEDWWSALLRTGLDISLDGDHLTATGSDGEMTIMMADAAVLHPDLPLGGTVWRLDGLVEGSGNGAAAMSAPGDATASLTISRDPNGHVRLDVFDGLTWMSAPGGFDAASGEYSGSVTIEPTTDDGEAGTGSSDPVDPNAEPLEATAGIVRVTGGLVGGAIGCASDHPDCRVAEMSLLGSDFAFEIRRDALAVTGLGANAGRGLTFVADPTAPAPDLNVYLAEADNPLLGRTFQLTRTFTDDGGANHKHADATLRLTFGLDTVVADGSCGPFTYSQVRYIADPAAPTTLANLDLGKPDVAGCVIGDDPTEPPSGNLMYGLDGDEMWLSTGYVGWYFQSIG